MTIREALDTIKNISIGTNAYETVDYEAMECGYEDYTYIEYEDCGTIEDNYDNEINILEKGLEILEIIKNHIVVDNEEDEFPDFSIMFFEEDKADCDKLNNWLKNKE